MQAAYSLPLTIAVTGHRDLRPDELEPIRERVQAFFADLSARFPEREVSVMSALAEGADRLVAREALDLGLELIVPLPMPADLYVEDFKSPESRAEFESLCARASNIIELPVARGSSLQQVSVDDAARARQYAQLGVFLCAHCHILLALWDGKLSGDLGGTGQVVRFHHDDVMPGYTRKTVASQQMLIDDESDLVYHVVCSRDRPDGAPQEGLEALDWWWFTKDRHQPRAKELPRQHQLIFERSDEFSAEAARFAASIESEKYRLLDDREQEHLPDGIASIDTLFYIADWLAIYYQKRTLIGLRLSHFLAFLMGFMFLLYSDLENVPAFIFAFMLFFVGAAAVQYLSKRRGWHRKYLDYRTLAEGLRVQYYWAAAGVTSENASKFTHDNFLQTQDPELGWIRNVMRVAGTRCDASPATDPAGVAYVIREWIGDSGGGQLGYFRTKTLQWMKRNRGTETLAKISLVTSVVVVTVMLMFGAGLSDDVLDRLWVVMGSILLLFGVRQAFAYSTAEKELIKQYDFMLRIFENARRRLETAGDDAEKRQILMALGGSALDEHTQWILMHRERSPDQAEIWRMGS